MEPEIDQVQWYLRRAGRQVGPLTSARVRRLLLEGQVTLDDEVSPDRKTWRQVAAVPEVVPPELRGGAGALAAAPKSGLPLLTIGVFLALIAAVIGFAVWWGGGQTGAGPNCGLAAAPGVDWSNCRFTELQAGGAQLAGLKALNGDLSGAHLGGADLTGARLDFADLRRADLISARLGSASLRGANLRGADLSNADLTNADLSFADLSQALLGGAILTGARLDGTLWIDGKPCGSGSLGRCLPGAAAR